ncbi:hypothetical protein SAMN02745121_08769 [Nannocystis exedens]|uniref:VWFA domain-containing protein n=1 Tax=Nannocystis exedens TaxID=54 RepID=A0A1I2IJ17_9BACT|nr:hypothetical protein [Nannocystis exedens]PCC69302.1 hypothetical protein NAEX_02324 [Nannocystis exedens]SFF42339.1 hypothetical protein SAMN02745121_08769 [Nannocystis exedens]
MWPWSRPLLALSLTLACQPSQTDTSPFTTAPASPATSDSTTTSSSGGSSSTTDGELSTGSGSGGASTGGTTLILDVGSGDDLGPLQPEGCKGKIDFLFVISRFDFMDAVQAQLADAVPKFLDTIQTKFAEFDYHIMVVKGDPLWGSLACNAECPGPFTDCQAPDEYACEMVGKVPECDTTWGAGAVFNAGENAPNKPCEIADGRRYLTRETPDLPESFACIAQVGTDGGDLLGEALVHAVRPELNGPGGCNEGFLRDDALLVVTLASVTGDFSSEGTPAEWAQAVIDAKLGDEGSVVMFGIGPTKIAGECWSNPDLGQYDRDCDLVSRFQYSHWISRNDPDYGPGFDIATDLVETACSKFIPQ